MQTNRQPSGKPARNLRSAVRAALGMGLLAGALCAAPAAQAATATGTLTVTATVASTCIVIATTIAFGSVSSAAIQSANVDATGTVSVNCTTGTTYAVALDKGGGTGATTASRKMTSGANLLNYTVYSDTARTTVWADVSPTSTVAGTGSGAAQTIQAYGRIFSGQTVPAATYTDVINVTVTY
jgi:spore coat protein U-like protein